MDKIGQGTKQGMNGNRKLRRMVARLDRRCADFANLFAAALNKPCPRCLDALNGVSKSRHCGNCSCCKGTPK